MFTLNGHLPEYPLDRSVEGKLNTRKIALSSNELDTFVNELKKKDELSEQEKEELSIRVHNFIVKQVQNFLHYPKMIGIAKKQGWDLRELSKDLIQEGHLLLSTEYLKWEPQASRQAADEAAASFLHFFAVILRRHFNAHYVRRFSTKKRDATLISLDSSIKPGGNHDEDKRKNYEYEFFSRIVFAKNLTVQEKIVLLLSMGADYQYIHQTINDLSTQSDNLLEIKNLLQLHNEEKIAEKIYTLLDINNRERLGKIRNNAFRKLHIDTESLLENLKKTRIWFG